MFTVKLSTRKGTLSFTATDHQSLMECAQVFEIYMPSSCRNGTCRECISKAHNGKVRYDTEWPGLSTQEKEEGWILPCVAIACSELEIENENAYLI